jgi:mono/diheme cytochrome c family protein
MENGPISAVLQQARLLADVEAAADVADTQLLGRFLAERADTAFAVLLHRHGPMVYAVGAAVPPSVLVSSSKAAALIAAGQAATGLLSVQAAQLAEGMVRAMFMSSVRRVLVAMLSLAMLGTGAGLWMAHTLAGDAPALEPADPPAPPELVQAKQPAGKADAALVKRGDYLVNVVARCGDCHTPRDATGKLDVTRHLQGAPTWFTPKVRPKGDWEDHAPDITMSGRAGKWAEAKMVKFLSTGERSDPPMPAYNLTVEDAQAVTAYLRSMAGRKKEAGGKQRDDD